MDQAKERWEEEHAMTLVFTTGIIISELAWVALHPVKAVKSIAWIPRHHLRTGVKILGKGGTCKG